MSGRALASTMRLMEIHIVLDRIEPPTGRLRVVYSVRLGQPAERDGDITFTGWLGLLRVLSEVTSSKDANEPGE